MSIAKYGIGIVVTSFIVFFVFLFLAIFVRHPNLVFFAIITGIFSFFNLYFFRDPERLIPENPDAILSPADGKIIQITEVKESEFFRSKVTRVSIFMSVFNVHVNRVPISGRIEHFAYHKGKFISAFKEKASLDNEQTVIGIKDEQGRRVLFKQIAGIIARRIVCDLREGRKVKRGERMGMIRYGSRVDIFFLPEKVQLKVKIGDKVKGGESIIGVFR